MADFKKKFRLLFASNACIILHKSLFLYLREAYSYPYHVVNFIFAVKRSRVLVTCVVTASVVVLDEEGRGDMGGKIA